MSDSGCILVLERNMSNRSQSGETCSVQTLMEGPTVEAEQRMGPAVDDLALGSAQQTAAEVTTLSKQCTLSSALFRCQHYCKELALLLLQHGCAHVRLSLRIIYSVNERCTEWLLQRPHLAQHPVVLLKLIARALHHLKHSLLQVARPLGQFLSQLISVKMCFSTNDDLDEQTKASARMNSAVSLFFGAIKLRNHSHLQLSAPSRQRQLSPEFSLNSPSTSTSPCACSPRRHGHSSKHTRAFAQQQLQVAGPSPIPDSSPRVGTRGLQQQRQQQQQRSFAKMQQSRTADSEVHVLCSSELRSAILDFLQHHSSAHGQEFVLLRSIHGDALCRASGLASAGSAPAAVAEPQVGHSGAAGAADANVAADDIIKTLSDCVVRQGAPGYVHQSRTLFQCLSDSSTRLTQSLDAPLTANLRSSRSDEYEQPDSFSVTSSRRHSAAEAAAAAAAANGGFGARSSWSGGSSISCGNGRTGDAAVAVSLERAINGIDITRSKGCTSAGTAVSAAESHQAAEGTRRRLGGLFVPSSTAAAAAITLLDPNLTPLMSFRRGSSSSRDSISGTQHSMFSDHPIVPRRQQQQQQQQQPVMLPACPADYHHHQQCYIGMEYKPARSPSPIATPARHGVRKSGSVKKPLPPPPFVLMPTAAAEC